jgi:hypothetical protein
MPYTIDDVVDFAMNQDHENLKAAIDDIMSSRTSAAIELRKEYIGSQLFNNTDQSGRSK